MRERESEGERGAEAGRRERVQSPQLRKIYFPHFNTLQNSPHNSSECVKHSFIRSETNFGGEIL